MSDDEQPELSLAEAFEGPSDQQIAELKAVLQGQSAHLTSQLQLLGQQPSPFLRINCEVAALQDFMFDDGEAREKYETAVEFRFNAALKAAMARLLGNVPADS